MTDTAKQPPDPHDANLSGFAETRLHDLGDTESQQEHDIALLAELLETGSLSERQIAAVMGDWSIHGSVPLAEHIENRGLLSAEQIASLMQRVQNRIERARQIAATDSVAPVAGDSLFWATLERIDGTGRVSKLLGVSVGTSGGVEDSRESDARYPPVAFTRRIPMS